LDALFKAFGGFFVRRGFPDPLYHTVLRRYLQLITRRGVTQGIFPEGGLTRDGALRPPKVGLLDALIQLADESELYFVPVGINYDRVLEDEALLAELRGREGPPSRLAQVRGTLRLLWPLLMERIARVIPATPVALVARAALDLGFEASIGDLVERVGALRHRLEEEGVPMAMGREFDPQRRARTQLRDDLAGPAISPGWKESC
jgi:1-acyl-sn-glycerol-3-phosphate acyltransferase